jgi:hypothetical protein
LDQAQPESPDGAAATVSGCIGLALGLLDQWLSGHDTTAPTGLGNASLTCWYVEPVSGIEPLTCRLQGQSR